jgi:hypothetical protein
MIATFFNIFPMDGSPLWLTNKSSLKNALGPPDLTRPRLRVSVSQATAVKQVASTAVFQAWGKRLHGLFFFYWTSVSTQGRYCLWDTGNACGSWERLMRTYVF